VEPSPRVPVSDAIAYILTELGKLDSKHHPRRGLVRLIELIKARPPAPRGREPVGTGKEKAENSRPCARERLMG